MIEFWPPNVILHTNGRIYRWIIHTSADPGTGIACHRSRSLLIATLSLWRWLRRYRYDKLPPATIIVRVDAEVGNG